MPLLRQQLPVELAPFHVAPGDRLGLVVVDEINGFCTVGMGNLVRISTPCGPVPPPCTFFPHCRLFRMHCVSHGPPCRAPVVL